MLLQARINNQVLNLLFPFQLKRVVVPSTIGILAFFSIHLAIQIMLTGNAGNCGCFGALLEMTPLEAIVKNAIAILLLVVLFFLLEKFFAQSFCHHWQYSGITQEQVV